MLHSPSRFVAEAEAEEVAEPEAEVTSSTSPEVGADAGAGRGRPRPRSLFFFFFFSAFGWLMAYIPVARDSFGATGCPRGVGFTYSYPHSTGGLQHPDCTALSRFTPFLWSISRKKSEKIRGHYDERLREFYASTCRGERALKKRYREMNSCASLEQTAEELRQLRM